MKGHFGMVGATELAVCWLRMREPWSKPRYKARDSCNVRKAVSVAGLGMAHGYKQ